MVDFQAIDSSIRRTYPRLWLFQTLGIAILSAALTGLAILAGTLLPVSQRFVPRVELGFWLFAVLSGFLAAIWLWSLLQSVKWPRLSLLSNERRFALAFAHCLLLLAPAYIFGFVLEYRILKTIDPRDAYVIRYLIGSAAKARLYANYLTIAPLAKPAENPSSVREGYAIPTASLPLELRVEGLWAYWANKKVNYLFPWEFSPSIHVGKNQGNFDEQSKAKELYDAHYQKLDTAATIFRTCDTILSFALLARTWLYKEGDIGDTTLATYVKAASFRYRLTPELEKAVLRNLDTWGQEVGVANGGRFTWEWAPLGRGNPGLDAFVILDVCSGFTTGDGKSREKVSTEGWMDRIAQLDGERVKRINAVGVQLDMFVDELVFKFASGEAPPYSTRRLLVPGVDNIVAKPHLIPLISRELLDDGLVIAGAHENVDSVVQTRWEGAGKLAWFRSDWVQLTLPYVLFSFAYLVLFYRMCERGQFPVGLAVGAAVLGIIALLVGLEELVGLLAAVTFMGWAWFHWQAGRAETIRRTALLALSLSLPVYCIVLTYRRELWLDAHRFSDLYWLAQALDLAAVLGLLWISGSICGRVWSYVQVIPKRRG